MIDQPAAATTVAAPLHGDRDDLGGGAGNGSAASRRRLVRHLVTSNTIRSQRQLASLLEAAGHRVAQATISRDLEAIGAVKVRTSSGHHYRITADAVPTSAGDRELRRVVDEFVDGFATSGNLLVVRTRPGAAHIVGSAMDRAPLHGMLGTVAGDDTLLVVASEETGPDGLIAQLTARGARV